RLSRRAGGRLLEKPDGNRAAPDRQPYLSTASHAHRREQAPTRLAPRPGTGEGVGMSFSHAKIRCAAPDDASALAVLYTELGYPSAPHEIQRRLPPIL